MTIWLLYLLLLRAVLGSFSGFASVPVVREDLIVRRAVLTDDELNTAIAISQSSPGPLGLYVVPVGYFVAGYPGALAAVAALATPALFAVPLLGFVHRQNANVVQRASRGIIIAGSVLMLRAALDLAFVAANTTFLAILAAVGFATLATGRVAPVIVVAAAGTLTATSLLFW